MLGPVQKLLSVAAWGAGAVLAGLALTHITSALVPGAVLGAAACANNPKCRTSALRGTEAIFGICIAF
jgi:hypothetical protein